MATRKLLRKSIPGIVDVAARARVSPATVSRFFNKPEIVSYKTRQRIEKAVDALGYVPNSAARSLNRGATGTIGLIVPTIDNAIFSEFAQAFSTTLFRHSRTMLIASHGYDLSREAILVESLLAQQVDALALVGVNHAEETFDMLERRAIPAVMVWNYRQRQRVPCIGVDNRQVGRTAAQHLIDLGHRDILFLYPESRMNDRASDRRSGALAAMNDAGIAVPSSRRMVCPYDVQAAKDIVAGVLREATTPTAILCCNDVIALGALYAASALELSLPHNLSVIGVGDFHGSSAVEPGLTTIRIPARRIGRRSAEALIEMIEWPDAQTRFDEQLPVELLMRGSTGPPPPG